MTLSELRKYLGHMDEEQILVHVSTGVLPPPSNSRAPVQASARWDVAEVNKALDAIQDRAGQRKLGVAAGFRGAVGPTRL